MSNPIRSLLITVALIGIVAGLGCLGYLWFGRWGWTSMPGQIGFGAAGIAYGAGAAYALSRLARQSQPALRRSAPLTAERAAELARANEAWERRRTQRVFELLQDPDPRKLKYLTLAQDKGILFSDYQIDYELEPERTITCPHLRELEIAMRRAGIELRPLSYYGDPPSSKVWARVSIDEPAVRALYQLPAFVRYGEEYEFVLAAEWLECTACQSRIEFAPQTATRFPA
jgi:hypothetical protein